MATYRLYCLGKRDEIIASHWVKAPTDEEAIEMVKREHPNARCELWLEKRLVAEIET